MRFVDTNVLLYAISPSAVEAEKAELAASILAERDLALSAQVLQEFYVQATRDTAPDPLDHDLAVEFLGTLKRYPIQAITADLVDRALDVKARWQLSYWDASIVAAAQILDCHTLLTEDLQHGQEFDGVAVANPFLR